jgi:RNA polymerase sigma factor (TIGR02999 family)
MSSSSELSADVTQLLEQASAGDRSAADALLAALYDELRRLATSRMAREPAGHTLQPTALVHEAWLRLAGDVSSFENRAQFFAAAAIAMRRILIERARRVGRQKRGGDFDRVEMSHVQLAEENDPVDLIALDGALTRLEEQDAGKATVVSMRFLLGCTVEETASALGISPAKVKKDWAFARAWLKRELGRSELGD